MAADHSKSDAQYLVSLVGIIALALATVVCLVTDRIYGQQSQTTGLLAGGLISICSTMSGWLFKNGNGSGTLPPEAPMDDRIGLGV